MSTRSSHDEAERIFAEVYEDVNNSPRHKERELEIRELGRKIMDQLGLDRTLFLDYEKLMHLMESFRIESAYEIGLKGMPCQCRCRPICRPKD